MEGGGEASGPGAAAKLFSIAGEREKERKREIERERKRERIKRDVMLYAVS